MVGPCGLEPQTSTVPKRRGLRFFFFEPSRLGPPSFHQHSFEATGATLMNDVQNTKLSDI